MAAWQTAVDVNNFRRLTDGAGFRFPTRARAPHHQLLMLMLCY